MEATVSHKLELQFLEYEARRLRAEYANDALIGAAVAVDLAIRRAACRILSLVRVDFPGLSRTDAQVLEGD